MHCPAAIMNMESIEVLPAAGKAHAGYDPPSGGDDDGNEENSRKKPVVRKRTKTGCQSKCPLPLLVARNHPLSTARTC